MEFVFWPIGLALFIVMIFFCMSMYGAMNHVPADKQKFPGWLVWFFLIPLVGTVMQWIMLPFGIPDSFKNVVGDNKDALVQIKTIHGLGLAVVILMTMSFIPVLNIFAAIPTVVLWIIYWVKVVGFKNQFLLNVAS